MTIDQATERKLNNLRIWNIVVGLILAAQAVVMAFLTNNFPLPVTATFMQGPPGSAATLHPVWNIQTGWGVFTFMAIHLSYGNSGLPYEAKVSYPSSIPTQRARLNIGFGISSTKLYRLYCACRIKQIELYTQDCNVTR